MARCRSSGAQAPPLGWVRLHESRRHSASDLIRPDARPATHAVHRAAIDAAAWERSPRTAAGLLAATVQQRLTSPDALLGALDRAGRVRHRKLILATLRDIAGGSEALSEIDLLDLCRESGPPCLDSRRRARTDDLMRDAELARHESDAIRIRLPATALRTERTRVTAILRSVLLP